MRQASVGFHCPQCAAQGQQKVVRGIPTVRPVATMVLIGLSVIGLVWSLGQGSTLSSISGRALIDGGLTAALFTVDGALVGGVDDGEFYRLVSSAFLHDGLIHIGFNMYALWILGPLLERLLGPTRLVSIYVVSMLGGSAGVLLLEPNGLTVGASGAVFGLAGAVVMAQRAAGMDIWRTPLVPVLALNLVFTFAVPQISVGGHLGGLIAGTAFGALALESYRRRQSSAVVAVAAVVVSAGLVALAIWAAAQWPDPLF